MNTDVNHSTPIPPRVGLWNRPRVQASDVHPYARHVNPDLADLLAKLRLDKRYVRGEGCLLFDDEGRRYLDCIAAYGALPFGYNPPAIWRALRDLRVRASPASCSRRCSTLRVSSRHGWWSSPPPGLCRVTFANSGAEAVEAAIKLCRAATEPPGILSTHGSFHGKTLGALSATGNPDYQRDFGAPAAGFDQIPYGDVDALAPGPGRSAGPLRGLPRRADPGRGGDRGAAARLPRRGPRALHRGGCPARPRRDPDRPGTYRRPVRLRGRGGRARRAGAGQGAGRRAHPHRCRALHRGSLHDDLRDEAFLDLRRQRAGLPCRVSPRSSGSPATRDGC